MKIKTEQKLSEIQDAFSKKFHNLKIRFFKHRHQHEQASEAEDVLDPDFILKDVATSTGEVFQISPEMTVAAFEGGFQNTFGLGVQVFRKSGRSWIMTTNSDDWTLKRQNEEGAVITG